MKILLAANYFKYVKTTILTVEKKNKINKTIYVVIISAARKKINAYNL